MLLQHSKGRLYEKWSHKIKRKTRIRTNKKIHDILQWADMVTFTKSVRLKWYGQTERTSNKRMPQHTATARMEEIKKGGRPQKRWTDGCEIEIRLQWPETRRNRGPLYWKPRSTMDCKA